jgi:hypothetical protein
MRSSTTSQLTGHPQRRKGLLRRPIILSILVRSQGGEYGIVGDCIWCCIHSMDTILFIRSKRFGPFAVLASLVDFSWREPPALKPVRHCKQPCWVPRSVAAIPRVAQGGRVFPTTGAGRNSGTSTRWVAARTMLLASASASDSAVMNCVQDGCCCCISRTVPQY